jgi:hypothetical protein
VKKPLPDPRAQARRAALNALRRARRAATRSGVELSDWEGEFLGSVEDRIKTFGRAFGDPDKGAPGQALSMLQAVKLKEISVKAKGGDKRPMARKGPRGRRPYGPRQSQGDEA